MGIHMNTKPTREVLNIEGHAFFITFSCYRRLSLLGRDRCKQIVLGNLDALAYRYSVGVVGFCVMPNHVHVLLRPENAGELSSFMQQWKMQSSTAIQHFLRLGQKDDYSPFAKYVRDDAGNIHVWQAKYYPFNVFSASKAIEKLEYMHNNPVKAGLVTDPCDWKWSSAAYFLKGESSRVRLVPVDGPFEVRLKANTARRR